jgi:hypothetical protein
MKKLIITIIIVFSSLGLIYFIPKIISSLPEKPKETIKMNLDGVTFETTNPDFKIMENNIVTLETIKNDEPTGYKIKLLNQKPTGIDLYFHPLNLIWYKGNILFANVQHNCISVMNLKGEIIENIGTSGEGQCEFNGPINICADKDNNYYVLDCGNKRVQILNDKFDYISEIDLKSIYEKFNKDIYFSEPLFIAATKNGDIYITLKSNNEVTWGILYISADRKTIKIIGDRISGTFFIYKDELYLLETYEIKEEVKEGIEGELHRGKMQIYMQTGKNRLFKLKDGVITETYNFTESFNTNNLTVYNDKIYTFSGSIHRLCEFNLKGEYIKTLFDGRKTAINEPQFTGFLPDENEENSFYAIHFGTGDLYKFYKE